MNRKLQLCIVGLVVVAAAGAALYLAAGRPVPISQVLREPAAYEGKSITVAGTVDGVLKVGPLSGFRLRDGSDTLLVSAAGEMPPDGRKVRVRGKVTRPVQVSMLGVDVIAIEAERWW